MKDASGHISNVLIDKAKMESRDTIKLVPNGEEVMAWSHAPLALRRVGIVRGIVGQEINAPGPFHDGDEFKLASIFKIIAVRMLMTGKATE